MFAKSKTEIPADNPLAVARSPSVRRRVIVYAALGLVFAFHLCVLAGYFPPGGWGSDQPFYTKSYALHFAIGEREAATLRRHARLWSYSPMLMAGYPAATRTEPVGAAVGPWLALTGGLPPAVAYKLLVLILLGAAPLAMAVAARWLELSAEAAILAALMATLGIFSALGLSMIRSGMFAFLSASYLAVVAGAWMYRCVRCGKAWRFAALALGGGALTYLHPLSPLLLAGPALATAAFAASAGQRRMLALLAAFAGVFAIALGWLLPIAATLSIGVHFANWWASPGNPGAAARDLISLRVIPPPLAMLALATCGATIGTSLPTAYRTMMLACIAALAALAYLSSPVPGLNDLEPGRFAISFYFLAVPLSAAGGIAIWRRVDAMRPGLGRAAGQVATLTALVFSCAVLLIIVIRDLRINATIVSTLPAEARELREWIETAPAGSRVIVESGWKMQGLKLVLPYFGADLGMLWAIESGRELIGGSPSEGFSTYSFTNFDDRSAFGRPLGSWTPRDLRAQFDLYDVGAALLWSGEAKRLLAAMPGATLAHRDGGFELYTIANPAGPLAAGHAASVTAGEDCIVIRSAQAGPLVLRYHYFKTLRAAPPLRIAPAPVGNGDPVGFIAIQNDVPRDLVVYNAGFTGRGTPACADARR